MDMQMPEMTGDEATEKARAGGYKGIIVMVSGDNFVPSEQERLRTAGVSAFLAKMEKPGFWHCSCYM